MTVPWHRALLAPLALAAVVVVTGCADASGPRYQIALAGAATAQPEPPGTPGREAGSAGRAGAASSAPPGTAPITSAPTTPAATTSAGPALAAACSASLPGGLAARVDLAAAALTCAQATSMLTAYVSAADEGSNGNTKALVVSGWACQSPTAARGGATGVLVICTKNAQTLIARGV